MVVYPVASRREMTFYRRAVQDEKAILETSSCPETLFHSPLIRYRGNAPDFSSDLSSIVYGPAPAARPICIF